MKAVFVFCEGEHDIAFVCRTLIAAGDFERDDTKIAKLPELFRNFLVNRFKERNLEKADAQKYSKAAPPVLWDALKPKNKTLDMRLWFFCAFGQDQHQAVGKFIEQFQIRMNFAIESGEETGISSTALAFLYDADEEGESSKLVKWKRNYESHLPSVAELNESGWQILKESAYSEVGVYILRGHQQMVGELEDIVLPLMKSHNESLYDEALAFVDKHWESEKTLKKKRKAAITVAGQIRSPSCSMAVILRETLHLEDAALNADPACQSIVRFFRQVCQMP